MNSRWVFTAVFAVAGNVLLQWCFPWRGEDPLLQMIGLHNARVLDAIWMVYQGLTMSGPLLVAALLYTTAGVVGVRKPARMPKAGPLPELEAPEDREELYVVLGEKHHPRRLLWPSPKPAWVKLRNLEMGIIALGLPSTGKTQCVMYPVAKQLLRWRKTDAQRKIAALVLEVKGSFCLHVKEILEECGRGDDYIEISVGGKYRWNPLLVDMDPGGIAASLAMIMEQLHAKVSSEPFWTDAVVHLLEHVIMLHRAMRDYLTFVDVYNCITSEQALEETIQLAGTAFTAKRIGISQDDYRHKIPKGMIDHIPWTTDDVQAPGMLVVEWSAYMETLLRKSEVDHVMLDVTDPRATDNRRRAALLNVSSWYKTQWLTLDQKVRTGVIQTVAPFLAHFVNNEEVCYTFCPPKEAYDPSLNPDGKRYGKVLPPIDEMMESGLVVGLNMSMAAEPAMARTVATILKNWFQRAMLLRIPKMKMMPRKVWRYVAFVCDEYHWLCTCGGSSPAGDEKFFSVSREAMVIPLLATQSMSSIVASLQDDVHRTNSLTQLFQTKIILRTNDPETAKAASELCGREDQLREGFAIGESGGEAEISLLSGKPYSRKSGLSVNHSWNQQKDVIFEPRIFGRLPFAASIMILPAQEPSIVYLKPDFAPADVSYFEQIRLRHIRLESEEEVAT